MAHFIAYYAHGFRIREVVAMSSTTRARKRRRGVGHDAAPTVHSSGTTTARPRNRLISYPRTTDQFQSGRLAVRCGVQNACVRCGVVGTRRLYGIRLSALRTVREYLHLVVLSSYVPYRHRRFFFSAGFSPPRMPSPRRFGARSREPAGLGARSTARAIFFLNVSQRPW